MSARIMVFIPAYNCEKQITRVLAQFNHDVLQYIQEIVVVNNCSTDNTENAAIGYARSHIELPLTVLCNEDNYNLGGSHKVAFQYAMDHNYDYLIVLHGDDQGNIQDIMPYLQTQSYCKYDSMLGARFLRKSKLVNYSKFRILGNHLFNCFISLCVGQRICDLGSGLNLYKVQYLKNHFYFFFPNTLTFNVYLLLYGIYAKSNFKFFPLTWREDDQVSNAKFFQQSLEILKLVGAYVFNKRYLFSMSSEVEVGRYRTKTTYRREIANE